MVIFLLFFCEPKDLVLPTGPREKRTNISQTLFFFMKLEFKTLLEKKNCSFLKKKKSEISIIFKVRYHD